MNRKKYKILVLSNLKDSTDTILKSTISLSKIVDSEIHFFCVKRPTEIVKRDNQLSAIRTINQEHLVTDKKIQELVQPLLEQYNVTLNYSYAFGNVKEEITNIMDSYDPDIVVLGKRKVKSAKLFGDGITQFVLKKYNGAIMIAADENRIEPNEHLSIGLLDGIEETFNLEFAKDLLEHIQKPIKSFKVVKTMNNAEGVTIPKSEKTIEYVFEHRDGAIQNLSNYLSKSKVNLLCIDRSQEQVKRKSNHSITDIKDAIEEFNVSILLTGGPKLSIS